MNCDVSFATAARPDRRTARRRTTVRPAKVFDARAERYFPAETTNLSASGAMLIVNRSMPLTRGDVLEIGILESPTAASQPGPATAGTGTIGQDDDQAAIAGRIGGEGVLSRSSDFTSASVVRVMPVDAHVQAVAVQFSRLRTAADPAEATPGVEVNLDAVENATRPRTVSRRPAEAA